MVNSPLLLVVPLLPFLGYAVNLFLGRRLPKAVSGTLACAVVVASFGVALDLVLTLVSLPPASRALEQTVYTWIASGDFSLPLTLRLDPLAAVMILIITGIGSLIHIYSTAYMHEETDAEYARYFCYLNLFVAFMLLLVLGANFLVMFVGWEGVGLCSYLLIGFWYHKKSAGDAGKKAFIVNRVGDFAFILGMLLAFVQFGTLNFQAIARAVGPLAPEATFGTLSVLTLLLFIGATGKSAQIPLYIWLPDAMEGPTPVSALIHAATMVTAGVYMIGRNAVLFSHAPGTLEIIAVVGTLTALMAATIGLVQNDIKRVLAYSTVSQLGYMFMAMGVGAYAAGIFHLLTHAFFKALLFLGSGAVIHALGGEQDMRRMGGLRRELPVTYWTFLAATLAIAGVPGLSGFFSKDEILGSAFATGHTVLWFIGVVTALLTAAYMFRLFFLTFHGEPAPAAAAGHAPDHGDPHAAGDAHAPHDGGGHHLHDAPPAMAFALIVLAIGAIGIGYLGVPASLGGSDVLGRFLAPSFTVSAAAEATPALPQHPDEGAAAAEGVEMGLMGVSTLAALGGIGLAFFFFLRRREASDALAARFAGLHRLLLHKYYVDEIYDAAIVQPIRLTAQEGLWRGVDVRVIDGAVNGVGEAVADSSALLRRLQTGSVRAYAASAFLGVILILGFYLWY
ncbi:MAG TPA: NADH-quinone oxidoreductase subunit L [Vicinamibacterales bacterium]|nr:NADH-quinone oxidoreductase subunit L [Vicinamibacterales bacterium]